MLNFINEKVETTKIILSPQSTIHDILMQRKSYGTIQNDMIWHASPIQFSFFFFFFRCVVNICFISQVLGGMNTSPSLLMNLFSFKTFSLRAVSHVKEKNNSSACDWADGCRASFSDPSQRSDSSVWHTSFLSCLHKI